MNTTTRIAAATAGLSALAGVAWAARRRFDTSSDPTGDADVETLRVFPSDEGWAVRTSEDQESEDHFDTKRQAVRSARRIARQSTPSRLVIHGMDGRIQRHHSYEQE